MPSATHTAPNPDTAPLRLLVVVGTTREGRFSETVRDWVRAALADRDDITSDVLDLKSYSLPDFYGAPPAREPRRYPTEELRSVGEILDTADGFLVLTGEYNHGYPADLKRLLDWFFEEWRRKPVAFVGWGNVGGARAVEQLRQVAVELEMAPTRHALHILPEHLIAARASGPAALDPLRPRLDLAVDDLGWWAAALREARRP
jgi:NAD(P)H-dependent FMN reductase